MNNTIVRLADRITQRLYILTDGRVGHWQIWTILLLTTTGRKTGKSYTHSLAYLNLGDRLLVAASNNGGDKHPAWYLNLVANPRVFVRFGRNKGYFIARTATAEERKELWPRLVAYNPPYETHQQHTSREIPVVILTRE